MSRRGASLPARREGEAEESEFEFHEVSALGRPVVAVARRLLERGLSSAEVCSLFAQTAAVLAVQKDGLSSRQEWLALAAELFDETAEPELALTSPGGVA